MAGFCKDSSHAFRTSNQTRKIKLFCSIIIKKKLVLILLKAVARVGPLGILGLVGDWFKKILMQEFFSTVV